MLAVAGKDENLEAVKILLSAGADFQLKDEFGNSILHIAAIYGNVSILEYLAKNCRLELFMRNDKGETALSIFQDQKNQKGIDIMNAFKDEYDKSAKVAE